MSTRRLSFTVALAFAFGAGTAAAETPGLGKPISEADIKAWDIAILPDGTGLPQGSGTSAQGAPIYAQKCAMCHGENGVNPARGYVPMVGVKKWDRIDTPKTVTYYGHATTLFDIIRRGMPYQMPRTLSADEVYALTAYILELNKIIGENEVMNAETLPKVKMPNADNFIIRFPDRI
jgi:S-disulfanyl-L-cysteine oxidoreductase SoxD